MKWKGRRGSDRVIDARGRSGGVSGAGAAGPLLSLVGRRFGIKGILILVVVGFVLWKAGLVDPTALVGPGTGTPGPVAETEAEREPLPYLCVVADRHEDVGVDHAAPAELDPPRVGAHAAALAVAEHTAHGELGRGLGVGEVVGSEARAHRGVVEELTDERLDRPEEVGHREVAVDGQALDLMEHRGEMRWAPW